ncbi:tetratricopeptide repeat protein [Haliovirga abyssi]|uniref:Tetratricopeptide repeat protein n=1 Tax=Haliovirga abyssi TaxID=2996794 RepID=A0AAU9D9Q9_9FUSO|nr:tetratricopeptide repeat protein [Haliovirga abyssi]BDU50050.1 hypothetical protein HLVA_06190 [Haliovirga abyssi]
MFDKIFSMLDPKYLEVKALIKKRNLYEAYQKLKYEEDDNSNFLKGIIFQLLKNYKRSLKELLKIDEMKEEELEEIYYEILGTAYLEEKNYLDATKNYLKALNMNKNNFYCKYNLANIYIFQKNYNRAYVIYEELIKEKPEDKIIENNFNLLKEKVNK